MKNASGLPKNLPELGISDDLVASLLKPFVLESFERGDPQFEGRANALARRWRRKHLVRRLIGWRIRNRRTRAHIEDHYNALYSKQAWPMSDRDAPVKRRSLVEWRNQGLVFERNGGGTSRVQLLVIERVLAHLRPSSVLEVGAGNGANLFVLASLLPGASWTGIELTEQGVCSAHSVQAQSQIPDWLVRYCPKPVADDGAYRRIDFQQGDASRLPFPDNSFDVVITRLALEQMDKIRDAVLSEITRVARHHVVMGEPFADFNRTGLRHDYVKAKEYLGLSVADLPRFGLEPIVVYDDVPSLLRLGMGIVVTRVSTDRG